MLNQMLYSVALMFNVWYCGFQFYFHISLIGLSTFDVVWLSHAHLILYIFWFLDVMLGCIQGQWTVGRRSVATATRYFYLSLDMFSFCLFSIWSLIRELHKFMIDMLRTSFCSKLKLSFFVFLQLRPKKKVK